MNLYTLVRYAYLAAMLGMFASIIEAAPQRRAVRTVRPAVRRPVIAPRTVPNIARKKPKLIGPQPKSSFRLSLPVGAITLSVGNTRYYRFGGAYYRRVIRDGRWVYVAAPAPIGVAVAALPESPERVVVNGRVYYRAHGTFYAAVPVTAASVAAPVSSAVSAAGATSAAPLPVPRSGEQYVVVKPPIGAVIDNMPAGYEELRLGPRVYYRANDSYLLPIRVDGTTKFVVVENPVRQD